MLTCESSLLLYTYKYRWLQCFLFFFFFLFSPPSRLTRIFLRPGSTLLCVAPFSRNVTIRCCHLEAQLQSKTKKRKRKKQE